MLSTEITSHLYQKRMNRERGAELDGSSAGTETEHAPDGPEITSVLTGHEPCARGRALRPHRGGVLHARGCWGASAGLPLPARRSAVSWARRGRGREPGAGQGPKPDVSCASKWAVYTDPRHHSDAQSRGDRCQSSVCGPDIPPSSVITAPRCDHIRETEAPRAPRDTPASVAAGL